MRHFGPVPVACLVAASTYHGSNASSFRFHNNHGGLYFISRSVFREVAVSFIFLEHSFLGIAVQIRMDLVSTLVQLVTRNAKHIFRLFDQIVNVCLVGLVRTLLRPLNRFQFFFLGLLHLFLRNVPILLH